jgi:glutamate-1-semialdehyde aminotransferase
VDIANSKKLWEKALKVIPGGSQTLSKAPNMFTFGVSPMFLQKGEGAYVWDVDGNKFIDYPLALGPITLGHNHPSTVKAVTEQLKNGTVFSLMHPLEAEVAEMLVESIPCAEMVKFGKNGADATSAAIRLSRKITGNDIILSCGYHGYHDWYISSTELRGGVPEFNRELIHSFDYNNPSSLEELFSKFHGKVAAVILEPVSTVSPDKDFLHRVKEITHKNGAILVFDEIVTGFRLAMGGASEYYGVTPDLSCIGKGMANGMPISALVGKKELMQEMEGIFFSTTYGGETLSLAATKATICEMREKSVQKHLWEMGEKLQSYTAQCIKKYGLEKHITLTDIYPKFWMNFIDQNGDEDNDVKGLFFQETALRGVLVGGLQYISYSHSEQVIEETKKAFDESLEIVGTAVKSGDLKSYLKGTPPGNVFKRSSPND